MKITTVDASSYTVPVSGSDPDEDDDMTISLVSIETDEGLVGYGETGYLHPNATTSFINDQLAPRLVGEDPLATARIWETLHKEVNPRSQTGAWSTAVSAVDIALWDVKGKAYDEPVWRLLGGARETVPVYYTLGDPLEDPEAQAEVARELVDDGATQVKVVVGKGEWATPRADAARIRAVQDEIGDDVDLAIDANYLYSLEEALELCNRIDDRSIMWFEEPVYGNDPSLLADLRERTRVPIAAGQNEGIRFNHRDLIANGAVDVPLPNVCFLGGYTEAQRVAGLADSFNLRVAHGGGWPFQNLHLMGGVANASVLEFHDSVWEIGNTIYDSPPQPEGDSIEMPTDPGLGLEPDESALERYETSE